ncbi:MAG: glycosyltransferase [Vicinamibacterales bacterium]
MTTQVSVVVPAFNAGATLARSIESLIDQTSPAWEAIIVDDGSADGTADIARTFAARDVRVQVATQHHGGESAARNAGVARATAPWLLFLDADDWIAPQHLERMVGALSADPRLDAVHCRHVRVAPDGAEVHDDFVPPTGDLFATLARRAAFPVHACVVRRALVERVGRFDTSLPKSPDWDLWQRIARTGARFGHVPEVLAYYRMQPHSASLDGEGMLRHGLTILRRGHARDPRVANPHPAHATGEPPSGVVTQQYYLASWCAGLVIGRGGDAALLLDHLGRESFRELYPDAVAECLFGSVPLARCLPPSGWGRLWPGLRPEVEGYLRALERRSGARGLALRAVSALERRIQGVAVEAAASPWSRGDGRDADRSQQTG